jgi:hypothetical protein
MASIPLVALHAEQQPNVLDTMSKVMQLRSQQQAQQQQNIALQQAQQDQKDSQTVRQAFQETNGDLDKTIATAAKRGVSPKTLIQLQQHALDVKTKTATLTKDQLANLSQQNDNAAGLIHPIIDAPPEKQAELYAQARQKALENPQAYGITDPSQIPEQFPGAEALKTQIAMHKGGKQQAEEAIKQREVAAQELRAKNTGGPDMAVFNALQNGQGTSQPVQGVPAPDQAPQAQPQPAPQAQVPVNPPATGQPAQPNAMQTSMDAARAAFAAKQQPAPPPVNVPAPLSPVDAYQKLQEMKQDAKPEKTDSVDQQGLADFIKKNPGKGASDYLAWKARQAPLARISIEGSGATVPAAPKDSDGTPLTGNDLLKTFGATASVVKSIAEGRQPMPSGFALKSPYWNKVMQQVYQYDPDFSTQRAQIRKAFTTGPDGKNIGSLNTATVHLDNLGEAARALDNGSFRPGNAAYNAISKMFGSNAPTDFDSLKSAVAGEMANAMKGNATDIEIRTIGQTLDRVSSPKQLAGVVNDFLHLNAQKLNTYQERYSQQIPGDTTYSPVLPSAAKVFEKHGIGTGASAPSGATKPSGKITVTAPDGSVHPFETQVQADAFKQLIAAQQKK